MTSSDNPSYRKLTSFNRIYLDKARCLGIIDVVNDRSIFNLIDRLVDYEERNEKPFARDNGISETVLNLNIETRRVKYPVDQLLKLRTTDVVE